MILTILLWIVLAIVAFGLRQPWSPRRATIAGIGGLVVGAVLAYFNAYPGSVRGILALLSLALIVSGWGIVRRIHSNTRPLSRWMPLAGVLIAVFLVLAGLYPLTSWGARSVNEPVYNSIQAHEHERNASGIDLARDVRVVPWDLASKILGRAYGADASWLDTSPDSLQVRTFPDTVRGEFVWVQAPAPETSKWLLGGQHADRVVYVKNEQAATPVVLNGSLLIQPDAAWWHQRVARYAEDTGEFRYVLQDTALQLDDDDHPYWIAYLSRLDIRSQPHLAMLLVIDATTGAEKAYAPGDAPSWIEQVYPETYVYEWAQYWGAHRNGFLYRWFNATGLVEPDDVTVRYIRVEGQTYWLLPMKQLASSNLGGYLLVNTRTGFATFYDRFDAQMVDYDTAYSQLQAILRSGSATGGAGLIQLGVSEGYLYPIKTNDGGVREAYIFPLLEGLRVSRIAIIDAKDYLNVNRTVIAPTVADALLKFAANAGGLPTAGGANATTKLVKVVDGTVQNGRAIVDLNGTVYSVTAGDLAGGLRTEGEREFDELTLAIARADRGQDVTIEVRVDAGRVVDVTYPGVTWG